MSDTYYNLYLQKIFTLAKTMVIKSTVAADAVNTRLQEVGYTVDTNQPTTWRYYLNLAGLYHSTDTPMYITSLDTLETILFSVENLQLHSATKRGYRYGTSYYNALLAQYPNQETLILGCLNPVDLTSAVAGKDGQILYYDPLLVESQETNFIPKLQYWLNSFLTRWDTRDYGITDDLYPAARHGIMYLQLVPAIMNIRLENCKTRFAHSYHIREYLASHGHLDIYFDDLTIKQALWLYRNVLWVANNAGMQSTFASLIQHIMTERGLPLASYDLRHNLKNQPASLYPDIEMLRTQLNLNYSGTVRAVRTIDEVLTIETPKARDNALFYDDDLASTTSDMKDSLMADIPTKVLESQVVDMADAQPYDLASLLLNHWLWFTAKGWYKATIIVSNPRTSLDMVLSAKEAANILFYAINKMNGWTLTKMPLFNAIHVRKSSVPTKAQLASIVPAGTITDALFTAVTNNMTVVPTAFISSDTFWKWCSAQRDVYIGQRFLMESRERGTVRGYVEAMIESCYQTIECNINAGLVYNDWFAERGLNVGDLSLVELELLAASIVSTATGADIHATTSMKQLQTAMLGIMAQLSSYTVQFLQTINDSGYKLIDRPVMRLNAVDTVGNGRLRLPNLRDQGLGWNTVGHGELNPELSHTLMEYSLATRGHSSGQLDLEADWSLDGRTDFNYAIAMGYPSFGKLVRHSYDSSITVSSFNSFATTLTETDIPLIAAGKLELQKASSSARFLAQTSVLGKGGYGYFDLYEDGTWVWRATSAHAEFAGGITYTDVLTVSTNDGAVGTVTVNVVGVDNPTVINSTSVLIMETNSVLTTTGSVVATDVDSQITFVAQSNVAGTYGRFTMDTRGNWSYVANSPFNEWAVGSMHTDVFTITVNDGTTGTVTIVMRGTDDLTILDSVTTDVTSDGSAMTVGGTIPMTDVDSVPTVVPQTTLGSGGYGTFTVQYDGTWSWASNASVATIPANQVGLDAITVTSIDGSTGTLLVRITHVVNFITLDPVTITIQE